MFSTLISSSHSVVPMLSHVRAASLSAFLASQLPAPSSSAMGLHPNSKRSPWGSTGMGSGPEPGPAWDPPDRATMTQRKQNPPGESILHTWLKSSAVKSQKHEPPPPNPKPQSPKAPGPQAPRLPDPQAPRPPSPKPKPPGLAGFRPGPKKFETSHSCSSPFVLTNRHGATCVSASRGGASPATI